MFLCHHPSVTGQNMPLAAGLYEGCVALYADASSDHTVLMAEYWTLSTHCVCAVELIFYNSNKFVEYRSFIKLPNNLWRNDQGEVSQTLTSFLPESIQGFRVFESMKLGPQIIANSSLTLQRSH